MGSAVGRFAAGIAIGLAVAWIYYIVVFIAPDGSVVWLVSLAPVLVIAFFIGYRVPDDVVKRWSKSHGVAITDENRDVLLRHLNRGRRIRTAGAVLGFLGYMVFTVEIAKDDASWGILRSTFFGYLIGAGIAEVWALRLRAQGPRVASLAPRAIRDYLPRLALFTLRLAALGTVALAVAWHWIPTGRDSDGFSRPDVGWIAMWAGISAVVSIFAELVMRSIVRRPQPAVSDELLRVDDAIRSSSIHQLAGAALALVLGILSARLGDLGHGPGGLESGLGVVGALCGLASILVWLDLGVDQKWVVRRSNPKRQEVTA